MRVFSTEIQVLHFFSPFRSNLNLAERHLAASPGQFISHIVFTTSRNLSKRKTLALGIVVPMETTHGTWSDVGLAKGLTSVLGNFTVQAVEVKNQSS
jgi:hypothetical protein